MEQKEYKIWETKEENEKVCTKDILDKIYRKYGKYVINRNL